MHSAGYHELFSGLAIFSLSYFEAKCQNAKSIEIGSIKCESVVLRKKYITSQEWPELAS